jgi:hypothetical protein
MNVFLGRFASLWRAGRRDGVWACGRVGVWACGRVGVWAYGRVGVWAYGRIGAKRREALLDFSLG